MSRPGKAGQDPSRLAPGPLTAKDMTMQIRSCTKCGNPVEKTRKRQAYCRKCHAAYMRGWRKTWTDRTMKKIAAAINALGQKAVE